MQLAKRTKQAKEDLKASAKAKLIAGEPLTAEEQIQSFFNKNKR